MPNAPEAVGARGQMRLEHLGDCVTQGEIGVSHNPRCRGGWPILSTRTLGSYALHKLRLPYGPHFLGAVFAVHRPALHEHCRDNVVPAVGILEQLVQAVAVIATIP